jgi:hypothetical protein
MLKTEFQYICQSLIGSSMLKDKKKKVRRKVVMIMTTTDAEIEQAIYNHDLTSIPDKKEEETISIIVEKKVKRSYNKKKTTL